MYNEVFDKAHAYPIIEANMALRYEIQKGAEHRVFAGDGVRNLGNGIVESDHELNSPYLKLIEDQPAAPASSAPTTPAATPQPPAPATQSVPQTPSAAQTNKEASSN